MSDFFDFGLDEDFVEVGDLLPLEDGWFRDHKTGHLISPTGQVYNKEGDLIDEIGVNDPEY